MRLLFALFGCLPTASRHPHHIPAQCIARPAHRTEHTTQTCRTQSATPKSRARHEEHRTQSTESAAHKGAKRVKHKIKQEQKELLPSGYLPRRFFCCCWETRRAENKAIEEKTGQKQDERAEKTSKSATEDRKQGHGDKTCEMGGYQRARRNAGRIVLFGTAGSFHRWRGPYEGCLKRPSEQRNNYSTSFPTTGGMEVRDKNGSHFVSSSPEGGREWREPGEQGKTPQRAENQATEGKTGKSGAKVMKSPENGAICAVLRRKRVHREKTMP